jgi:hypothetical protein
MPWDSTEAIQLLRTLCSFLKVSFPSATAFLQAKTRVAVLQLRPYRILSSLSRILSQIYDTHFFSHLPLISIHRLLLLFQP